MYLGIDIGTSSIKALLIDAAQTVIGSTSAPLTVSRPHHGWSEQDPADWITAAEGALDGLKREYGSALSAVRGIGLSGQMHGATLLGTRDEVLRPCILWNDTRAHEEAAALDADFRFRHVTGNIVFPGFTAPKLVWVRKHEPSVFSAVRWVLLPKDFLRLWLTGEHMSEMSDASGTSWLDVSARRWSPELLAATDLSERQMPNLVEGTDSAGVLRADLAARWGMGRGVVIAGGAGDNAATACGLGVMQSGQAFVSLGTSGVLFAANASYMPNAQSAVHTFCHALPDAWHQMGVILSAADSLNWLSGISGKSAHELDALVGSRLKAPSGVTFLPYISGERTPHNDAEIRGAFAGLSRETDLAGLAQGVMEGVAFAFRDCLEALKVAGTQPVRALAAGGGSRSRYWLEAIATALQMPVDIPAEGDFGAAFGAARLGLIASEGADPLSVCTPPAIAATIDPDRALEAPYAEAYLRFRALYPAVGDAG